MNASLIIMVWSLWIFAPEQRDATGAGIAPDGSATIAGVVISPDSATPAPVARVIVTVSGAALPVGRSAITDDLGRFAVGHLPPGRYSVSAAKPAYLSIAYGASRPGRAGVVVSLSAGQQITDLSITLIRGAVISGTIRDIKGRPASGAPVSATRVLADRRHASTPIATTQADDL